MAAKENMSHILQSCFEAWQTPDHQANIRSGGSQKSEGKQYTIPLLLSKCSHPPKKARLSQKIALFFSDALKTLEVMEARGRVEIE